jgi:hypothetical protein
MYDALSDERTDLYFAIAVGHRHPSHSRVGVQRDSWPHFPVSDSRLPQPRKPGPRIYIPQEQGGPVILSRTGLNSIQNRSPNHTEIDGQYVAIKLQYIPHKNSVRTSQETH